jgi:hypothetical protein
VSNLVVSKKWGHLWEFYLNHMGRCVSLLNFPGAILWSRREGLFLSVALF